jgi:hypothetical protein
VCVNWTVKSAITFLTRKLSLLLVYIYLRNPGTNGQPTAGPNGECSAQIAWCRSPTAMSVKTSYTILRGLDGIPHEMKTQRPQFYESRESERGQTRSFATRKRGLDDFYITRGESVSLFCADYNFRKK